MPGITSCSIYGAYKEASTLSQVSAAGEVVSCKNYYKAARKTSRNRPSLTASYTTEGVQSVLKQEIKRPHDWGLYDSDLFNQELSVLLEPRLRASCIWLHGVSTFLPVRRADFARLRCELVRLDQTKRFFDVTADGEVIDG